MPTGQRLKSDEVVAVAELLALGLDRLGGRVEGGGVGRDRIAPADQHLADVPWSYSVVLGRRAIRAERCWAVAGRG